MEWTTRFMTLHRELWPGWEGEADVLKVFGPEDFAPPQAGLARSSATRRRRSRRSGGSSRPGSSPGWPGSSATSAPPRNSPRTPWSTALEQWPGDGVPDNPGAWLMATAKHRAIDLLAAATELPSRKLPELAATSSRAPSREVTRRPS